MNSEDEFLEPTDSVVHFREIRNLDFLSSLEFIGGYSWWKSEECFHARAWFTNVMFVLSDLFILFFVIILTQRCDPIRNFKCTLPHKTE